jgi:hypothetical protein
MQPTEEDIQNRNWKALGASLCFVVPGTMLIGAWALEWIPVGFMLAGGLLNGVGILAYPAVFFDF